MNNFLIGIAVLLAGSVVSLCVPTRAKLPVVAVFTGVAVVFTSLPSLQILLGAVPGYWRENLTVFSLPFLVEEQSFSISLRMDSLSAFFAFFVPLATFVSSLYSLGYLRNEPESGRTGYYSFFFPLLAASMTLLTVVQHALVFLVVWEIMSVSSFFLVGYDRDKKEVFHASINYMIAMHVGLVFLIAGFLILYLKTGSFDFRMFGPVFQSGGLEGNGIFLLFFIGFGMKAGFFPLHTWLPKAHPAAPASVSGLMSGVMIKTGVYGILRVLNLWQTPSFGMALFILAISCISALVGIVSAMAQKDAKRMLAYSSVENIGLIGIGIGIGMIGLALSNRYMAFLGFAGALLHVLNHSLFKGLLFYGVGNVYKLTHTRNMEKLGGLLKHMPITGSLFLVGSIAISGLPPFNGFISEFFIYLGFLEGAGSDSVGIIFMCVLGMAVLSVIGALALFCFSKAFSVMFLGSLRDRSIEETVAHTDKKETLFSVLPLVVLALSIAFTGFLPVFTLPLAARAAGLLAQIPEPEAFADRILAPLSGVAYGSMILVGAVILLFVLRKVLLLGKKVSAYKTWDCGYQAGSPRIQYTGSSFSESLFALFRRSPGKQAVLHKPAGFFPKRGLLVFRTADALDKRIINPLLSFMRKFLDLFSWIQSGNTQQYLIYGIVFLVGAIVLIMGVR